MKVLVIGCGRVGSSIAIQLDREGWDVVAVDEKEEALTRLGSHWNGGFIVGHGMDVDVLRAAGIEEAEAKRLLAEAKAIGDLYGVNVAARIVRARAAGAAIVDETDRARTEIIVLRAPRKQRLGKRAAIFGKTVDYVLKKAPSEVLIVAFPQGVLEGDGSAT